MSDLKDAFVIFLSPIEMTFRFLCWAPSCGSSNNSQYLTNALCSFLTFVHFVSTILAVIKFEWLQLPDDFTNQLIVILIDLAFTVIMVESLVNQTSYQQIIHYLLEFDMLFASSVPEIDLSVIYDRWKHIYYKKVFSHLVVFLVCHEIGSMLYFVWKGTAIGLFGWLLIIGKLGIYSKTLQIAFYIDMVYERLELVNQTLKYGRANEVTTMYSILCKTCHEMNQSIGISLIIFYLQSVVDLVNVSHIMYWNVVSQYSDLESFGVMAYAATILMPIWELTSSCERCLKKVSL